MTRSHRGAPYISYKRGIILVTDVQLSQTLAEHIERTIRFQPYYFNHILGLPSYFPVAVLLVSFAAAIFIWINFDPHGDGWPLRMFCSLC